MRSKVLAAVTLALALLVTWLAEVLFDGGVVAALLFAGGGLLATEGRAVRKGAVAKAAALPPHSDRRGVVLAYGMPAAGVLAMDPEWRTSTMILYSAFILLAVGGAFSTKRREPLISAAIAAAVLTVEILRR